MLHRFGFTLAALAIGTPCAFAFHDDDGKKESVESKLLEILRSRQVINDAEFGELTALSVKLKAEEESASLVQGPIVRAAAGDGVTIEEGTFKLNIKNKMQLRFAYTDFDNSPPAGRLDTATFSVPRARTYLQGSVWDPSITWRLALEYNEAASVKDAWVRWDFWTQESSHSKIGFRMGQQKPHFGRVAMQSSFAQEFVDRDMAATTFSASRARGIQALGEHVEGAKFHWSAGMWNTDTAGGTIFAGEETSNADNELNFHFEARFDPWGDMGDESYTSGDLERIQNIKASIGAGLWLGNERVGTTGGVQDDEVQAINLNAAMKYMGFHALGELFLREDDTQNVPGGTVDSMGWNAQGTYTLAPNAKGHQISFGGRLTMYELSDNVPAGIGLAYPVLGGLKGDLQDITVGVTDYYKGHNLKTQLDVTFRTTDFDLATVQDRDDVFIRLQFTIQV